MKTLIVAYVIALADWPDKSDTPSKVTELLVGTSNESIESLFSDRYNSNDYALTYDDCSALPMEEN